MATSRAQLAAAALRYSAAMDEAAQACSARVVVFGASNAAKGISVLVGLAQRMLGVPLDVHAAIGHGRSYGQRSFLIARSIPGTLECSAWNVLRRAEPLPTYALLTDVGNDIMYNVPPKQILEWVDACVAQLQQHKARIVLTGLPIPVLHRIGRRRYLFFRTIFFPQNRLSLAEALDRARAVHDGLREISARRGVALQEQSETWYGVDPIHITRRARCAAWAEVLKLWAPEAAVESARAGSARRFLAIRTKLPEHWWLFNRIDLGQRQPAARLRDGTRVWLH